MYRLFNGAFACDFRLPGVNEMQQGTADLRIALDYGAIDESGYDWIHAWRVNTGELVLSCARQSPRSGSPHYLLRFPELADFVISENTVTCHRAPYCSDDTLCHLVLDQVIPRWWAHKGNLVLHASAVELPDGRVIAFLGESGWGKSTLAAALQARGGRLLGDDCISLKSRDGKVQLIPSYNSLRLNDDSIVMLSIDGQHRARASHYSGKRSFAQEARTDHKLFWLDTLYVMAEPGDTITLGVEALCGAELIATLTKRSFLLDIHDTRCAARQMFEAAAVLRAIPRVYSLDYPRDFQQLPALCAALSAQFTT